MFKVKYSHTKTTRNIKNKTPGNNNTRQKTKAENVKISEQTIGKTEEKHTDNTGSSSLSKIQETNYK